MDTLNIKPQLPACTAEMVALQIDASLPDQQQSNQKLSTSEPTSTTTVVPPSAATAQEETSLIEVTQQQTGHKSEEEEAGHETIVSQLLDIWSSGCRRFRSRAY